MVAGAQKLKILITIKTYPIPSSKYDELVCTAGVTETGAFVRLYPINFRELPYDRQYRKYQWIEVDAVRHVNDTRKESFRPLPDTLRILGDPIPTKRGDWTERARFVLVEAARSMENLQDQQERDRTSLGIFKPSAVRDLVITPDDTPWKPGFINALRQARLFETRRKTLEPPRKVPFKFHYHFDCADPRCKGHRMMIEDWEAGALFWNLVDRGADQSEAAEKVKQKFLHEMCGTDKNTHFYVGTVAGHPKSWVVVGVFWPKAERMKDSLSKGSLFEETPRW